eukprot:g25666.t1
MCVLHLCNVRRDLFSLVHIDVSASELLLTETAMAGEDLDLKELGTLDIYVLIIVPQSSFFISYSDLSHVASVGLLILCVVVTIVMFSKDLRALTVLSETVTGAALYNIRTKGNPLPRTFSNSSTGGLSVPQMKVRATSNLTSQPSFSGGDDRDPAYRPGSLLPPPPPPPPPPSPPLPEEDPSTLPDAQQNASLSFYRFSSPNHGPEDLGMVPTPDIQRDTRASSTLLPVKLPTGSRASPYKKLSSKKMSSPKLSSIRDLLLESPRASREIFNGDIAAHVIRQETRSVVGQPSSSRPRSRRATPQALFRALSGSLRSQENGIPKAEREEIEERIQAEQKAKNKARKHQAFYAIKQLQRAGHRFKHTAACSLALLGVALFLVILIWGWRGEAEVRELASDASLTTLSSARVAMTNYVDRLPPVFVLPQQLLKSRLFLAPNISAFAGLDVGESSSPSSAAPEDLMAAATFKPDVEFLFLKLLESFKTAENSDYVRNSTQLERAAVSSYQIPHLFIARDSDGAFLGAQYNFHANQLLLNKRDPSNGYCYSSYNFTWGRVPDKQASFVAEKCVYDPRVRPWYKRAVETRKPGWSDIYSFAFRSVGITYFYPYYQSPDQERPDFVMAFDLDMEYFTNFLKIQSSSASKSVDSLLSDRDLVEKATLPASASSPLEAENKLEPDLHTLTLLKLRRDAQEAIIQNAVDYFLELLEKGDSRRPTSEEKELVRELDEPFTCVVSLRECCGLDWLITVLVPRMEFLKPVEHNAITVVITACFIYGLLSLVVLVLIYPVRSRIARLEIFLARHSGHEEEDERDHLYYADREKELARLGDSEVLAETALSWHKDAFRDYILSMGLRRLREDMQDGVRDPLVPVTNAEVYRFFQRLAAEYVALAWTGHSSRNIMVLSVLCGPSYWLYLLQTSMFYQHVYFLLLCVHLALVMLLPATQPKFATQCQQHAVKPLPWIITILVLEYCDWLLTLYLDHKKRQGGLGQKYTLRTVHGLLLNMLMLEALIASVCCKRLPFLSIFTPIFAMVVVSPVRKAARAFARTMARSSKVFLMFVAYIMLASIFGLWMLEYPEDNPIDTGVTPIKTDWRNIQYALVHFFIFLTTSTNYGEFGVAFLDRNPLFTLFFFVSAFFGGFIMLGIFIGSFQTSFREGRIVEEKKETLRRRTGIVSAFIILDYENSESIPHQAAVSFLEDLLQHLGREPTIKAWEQPDWLDKSRSQNTIDKAKESVSSEESEMSLIDFTRMVEWQMKHSRNSRDSSSRFICISIQTKQAFEREHRNLLKTADQMCVFIHILTSCMLGIWSKKKVNTICGTVVLLELLLVWFKVEVFGGLINVLRGRLQYPSTVTKKGLPQPLTARKQYTLKAALYFDLGVLVITTIGWLVSISRTGDLWFGDFYIRWLSIMPLLRVFSAFPIFRDLLFPLFFSVSQFWGIFLLFVLSIVFFAFLGLAIFHDAYAILSDENRPSVNFDTFLDSLLLLLQLMTGADVDSVMWAVIQGKNSVLPSIYFMAFATVNCVIFTQLFIGLVLDAYFESTFEQEGIQDTSQNGSSAKQDATSGASSSSNQEP